MTTDRLPYQRIACQGCGAQFAYHVLGQHRLVCRKNPASGAAGL